MDEKVLKRPVMCSEEIEKNPVPDIAGTDEQEFSRNPFHQVGHKKIRVFGNDHPALHQCKIRNGAVGSPVLVRQV